MHLKRDISDYRLKNQEKKGNFRRRCGSSLQTATNFQKILVSFDNFVEIFRFLWENGIWLFWPFSQV